MADNTLASLTAATPATGGLLYGTQGGADRKFTLSAAGAALMEAAAPLKLDELATPTDVTTLNATTSAHGLLPKLGGGTTNFLRADGNWAAPGGGSINLPLRAWVESTGDDGTGTVGDPGKPYLTMLAAYTAGARMMHLGAGTFAGITKTGSIDLTYIGHGRDKTTITTITSTTGGAISLRDVGFKSATLGSITLSYAGTGGASAGSMILRGVFVSGNVTAAGEPGRNGDAGSIDAGNGGSAAILTVSDVEIGGDMVLASSIGGVPYDDGTTSATGGSPGSPGAVLATGFLRVQGNINISGGFGNAGVNGGGSGAGCSAGFLNADSIHVGGSVEGPPGDLSNPASIFVRIGGFINKIDLDSSMTYNGDISGQCLVCPSVMGPYISGSGLFLSYINGLAVGTS